MHNPTKVKSRPGGTSSRRNIDSPRPILIFVAATKIGPSATVVAATRSASDSILRCRKGEWFRLQNGLAAKVILDFRLRLENRCKLFPVYALQRASILDFVPRLENRCKDFLVSGLLRALILKFKPRLENRCKDFPIYGLLRAVILDLMGSIWESLQGFAYRISSLNDVRVRF